MVLIGYYSKFYTYKKTLLPSPDTGREQGSIKSMLVISAAVRVGPLCARAQGSS